MTRKKDRIGHRFGRLVILEEKESKRFPSGKSVIYYNCICDCGNTHVTDVNALRNGNTRSCGCLFDEGNNRKHLLSKTRFYRIWSNMKRRSGKSKYYEHVVFDKLWLDFNVFKKDMYRGYLLHVKKHGEIDTSIDRIDNGLGYSKSNCRWATKKEQSLNRNLKYKKHA